MLIVEQRLLTKFHAKIWSSVIFVTTLVVGGNLFLLVKVSDETDYI